MPAGADGIGEMRGETRGAEKQGEADAHVDRARPGVVVAVRAGSSRAGSSADLARADMATRGGEGEAGEARGRQRKWGGEGWAEDEADKEGEAECHRGIIELPRKRQARGVLTGCGGEDTHGLHGLRSPSSRPIRWATWAFSICG